MSTRAAIIRKTEDGQYEGIYSHWDGYLDGVGATLLEHYQDPGKVKRLLALGDISSLGERVEPVGAHTYDDPEEGTTVAYARDRCEKGNLAAKKGRTADEVAAKIGHNGYVYVFDGDWTCNGKPLAEAIKQEQVAEESE